MKLSLRDYSQCGVKKQTSKQKATATKKCLAGVHKEQVLWFLTSARHYPPGTASWGRFHIARLYLHPLLKEKRRHPRSLKKREFVL